MAVVAVVTYGDTVYGYGMADYRSNRDLDMKFYASTPESRSALLVNHHVWSLSLKA